MSVVSSSPNHLSLRVVHFDNPTRWRWVLHAADGSFRADHEVRVDAGSREFEAFTDLDRYLRWTAAPDRRIEHEAELLEWIGLWVGEHILGHVGVRLLEEGSPVSVLVELPESARIIASYPLESAIISGEPLSLNGITFVFHMTGGTEPPPRRRVASNTPTRLRVLALFSAPVGAGALNLRHERRALERDFHELAAVHSRAIDLQVLQYGASRNRLRELLRDAEGWDLIHISGHGGKGFLLLEDESGERDLVSLDELVDLLEPAGARLQLVTLSACNSASRSTTEERRLLQLPLPQTNAALSEAAGVASTIDDPSSENNAATESLMALRLAAQLGCAVLGMRFPVIDDFAIGFTRVLYDLWITRGHALPRAVSLALGESVLRPPSASCPAISLATPALFGVSALDLRLSAPPGTPRSFSELTRMSEFEAQPRYFVGRVSTMAAANAMLAPRSGMTGAFISGMTGIGKTACALELAYIHQGNFAHLVWHKASATATARDIESALDALLQALGHQVLALQGEDVSSILTNRQSLDSFLRKLTRFLAASRVLIVVDGLDDLLASDGGWRDERWARVVEAMTSHDGLSRVLMTGCRQPSTLNARVQTHALTALTADESILLARELPGLRDLLDDAALVAGPSKHQARLALNEILDQTQGHPALLKIAGGYAASPANLDQLLQDGRVAWLERGGLPHDFLRDERSTAEETDYLHVLRVWTETAVSSLPDAARLHFQLLCHMDGLPLLSFTKIVWTNLISAEDMDQAEREAEELADLLETRGLVEVERDPSGTAFRCRVHPQIAAAGRRTTDPRWVTKIDVVVGNVGHEIFFQLLMEEESWTPTPMHRHLAEATVPHLLRAGNWEDALPLLETLVGNRPQANHIPGLLPLLEQASAAARGSAMELPARLVLARALAASDVVSAEREALAIYQQCCEKEEHKHASTTADLLIHLYIKQDRLHEAAALAEEMVHHSNLAGLGPWSQLMDQATLLNARMSLDPQYPARAEAERLLAQARSLPVDLNSSEATSPYEVRETLLAIAANAARHERAWEETGYFDMELLSALEERGASPREIGAAQLVRADLLIQMGDVREAKQILETWQPAFDQLADAEMLARCRAIASRIERHRDEEQAIALAYDALRYDYQVGRSAILDIAASHRHLGALLEATGRFDDAVAHILAAALLDGLSRSGRRQQSQAKLGSLLLVDPSPRIPESVLELCNVLKETLGVAFASLLSTYGQDNEDLDFELQLTLLAGAAHAADQLYDTAPMFAGWDPILAGVYLASEGHVHAENLVEQVFQELPDSAWGGLVRILRRMMLRQRCPEEARSLPPVQAALVHRVYEHATGGSYFETAAMLWPAMRISGVLQSVVAGARGNEDAVGPAMNGIQALRSTTPEFADGLHQILVGQATERITFGLPEDLQLLLRVTLAHATASHPLT